LTALMRALSYTLSATLAPPSLAQVAEYTTLSLFVQNTRRRCHWL
jgi:hypothetical protein